MKIFGTHYLVCFLGYSQQCQDLLLAVFSGVTPGRAQRTICARNQARIGCIQGKGSTFCATLLVPVCDSFGGEMYTFPCLGVLGPPPNDFWGDATLLCPVVLGYILATLTVLWVPKAIPGDAEGFQKG